MPTAGTPIPFLFPAGSPAGSTALPGVFMEPIYWWRAFYAVNTFRVSTQMADPTDLTVGIPLLSGGQELKGIEWGHDPLPLTPEQLAAGIDKRVTRDIGDVRPWTLRLPDGSTRTLTQNYANQTAYLNMVANVWSKMADPRVT